jgi:hypothetical protein
MVFPSSSQLSVRRYEKVGTTDRRHETTGVLVVLGGRYTLKKVPSNRYVPVALLQPPDIGRRAKKRLDEEEAMFFLSCS